MYVIFQMKFLLCLVLEVASCSCYWKTYEIEVLFLSGYSVKAIGGSIYIIHSLFHFYITI